MLHSGASPDKLSFNYFEMKHHTLHIFCCLALGLLGLLASCYDEGWGDQGFLTVAAGEAVVKVSVPTGGGFGTKAYGDATADADEDERTIHSLWLLAYPVDGEDGEALVCPLGGSSTLEHDTWRTYNVRMKLGKYNVYVVANVEGISTNTTEDQLKDMALNYTDGEGNLVLPDVEDGLPMVYQSETPFEVTAQGGTIWATLEFTCVKVTYTLTFDNTEQAGISFPTFGKNYLTVENVTGKQIATEAPLLPTYEPRTEMELKDIAEGAFNGSPGSDATPGRWTYTATFYLPEHYVDKDGQSEQTYLDMTAALYSETGEKRANLQYTIPLGGLEDGTVNAEGYDRSELRRGTWYKIKGEIKSLGGVIEPTVVVEPWQVVVVDTDLESAYHLWVEQTALTQELPAGTAKTIACRTDAPRLEASSSKITVDGEEIDLFVVTLNQAENGGYTGFTVRVNPDIPPTEEMQQQINAAQDKCIWLHIPDPETDDYLLSKRIDIETVKLDPYFIVNPPQYTIYISEIGHQATYPVTFTYETNMTDVEVTCGGSTVTTDDITTWPENTNVTITDSGLQENGTGTVTVTLDKPYDPSLYTKIQTITIDYVATDNRDASLREEEQTTVTIIPNAQTYRLHFRPVTDDWKNPHIYVYEPLYTPGGTEIKIPSNPAGENAVLYGFTGMRTFKGWKEEGGDVENQWASQIGGIATAQTGFAPENGTVYNTSIDYCPNFREDCCASAVHPKWPGVKMKEDPENPGWYYFDLPALAEPGRALIMFAEGHSGPNDDNKQFRYPAHMVPGVPLYDYADKDGWFLYDYTKGDDNGFVDDKPGILDKADVLPNGIYRIWCTSNANYTRCHVWGDGDYATWGTDAENLQTDAETEQKYFDINVTDNWNPSIVSYKFYGSGDTGDLTISMAEWRKVTGKTYDYEVYK